MPKLDQDVPVETSFKHRDSRAIHSTTQAQVALAATMSNYSYPQHGATYMPGQDDYYEPQTPNVASPAPQR